MLNNKLMRLFEMNELPLPTRKIKLADNLQLSDAEFEKVSRICDIFAAIKTAAGDELIAPPAGGVFWNRATPGMGPFDVYARKNRDEINHLFLLFNAFRDFCALAYEYDEQTPAPDFWVRRYLRMSHAVSAKWRAHVPARLGELGWNIDGHPVNRWTAVNQECINAITIAGITRYLEKHESAQMLEIGGGAAEMGYALCKALPNCTWYDADLLGCLIYGAIHLAVTLPEKNLFIYTGNLKLDDNLDERMIIRDAQIAAQLKNSAVFIPHFLLDDFRDKLNLHYAYNTYSFGEMPAVAVRHYTELLDNFLKQRGILYEQNGYFPQRGGDNAIDILATKFKQIAWPALLYGRHMPTGPARVWGNNKISREIQRLISPDEVHDIIDSMHNRGDKVDIQYQNESLWPRVYELFTSAQRVDELYPR